MYQDKTITCKDCGKEFTFTAGEQEFFADKGLTNEPTRCKDCRTARKAKFNDKKLFTAVCSSCGKEAKVPFEPKEGRPVYCAECFSRRH